MEPQPLNLKSLLESILPEDYPLEPRKSFPNGPNCSAYGGTPILPSPQHYKNYEESMKEYFQDMLAYALKLKEWIAKHEKSADVNIQYFIEVAKKKVIDILMENNERE